jgi:TPR repeat protein
VNADEAAKSYLRAAVSGFVRAKFNLGILYLRGAGVERSADQAAHWIGEAADAGCSKAVAATSYLYANRLGVPRDERKARELIRKAPKTNDLIVYAN